MNAIELKGLTKRFGAFTAVNDLTFSISQGAIFGFLGPNGSGKSTCIRMLCGLLQPTSGTAYVNGLDITRESEAVKRTIGYMNQGFSLYRDLTVDENLEFYGGIYGLHGENLRRRKQYVIDLVGLGSYLDRRSGQLSGGWKQRLALAAAIIHEPDLIFLDEPTAGIDPVARRDLWDLLFQLAAAGKTLFVTTHYMDEAERCNDIAYIYLSQLMVKGSPNQLKSLPEVNPSGTRRISISSLNPTKILNKIKNEKFCIDATLVESDVHILLQDNVSNEEIISITSLAKDDHFLIRDISPSLEDVFVTLTRKLAKQ